MEPGFVARQVAAEIFREAAEEDRRPQDADLCEQGDAEDLVAVVGGALGIVEGEDRAVDQEDDQRGDR